MAQTMNADLTKMIRESALADQSTQDLIARLTERLDALNFNADDAFEYDDDEGREFLYSIEDALSSLCDLSNALDAHEGVDA